MNNKGVFFIIAISFLITACEPSSAVVEKAVLGTLTAMPKTIRNTSSSPVITETPHPTPISIPPVTAEPTNDTRTIDTNLTDYLLNDTDMQKEGLDFKTFIHRQDGDPVIRTNDSIYSSKYYDKFDESEIRDAARIISYERIFYDSNNKLPLTCELTLYRSSSGAQFALKNLNNVIKYPNTWIYLSRDMNLGDEYVIYASRNSFSGSEKEHWIEFAYRNVRVSIYLARDNPDLAERLAQIVLSKLLSAPLFNPTESSTTMAPTQKYVVVPTEDKRDSMKEPGIYLVGLDIAPGVWRNLGSSDSCYWAITDRTGNITNNFFGMTGGTMYIGTTDFQVQLDQECGLWMYIGQ